MTGTERLSWSTEQVVSRPVIDFARISVALSLGVMAGMYPTAARLDIAIVAIVLVSSLTSGVAAVLAVAFGAWAVHGFEWKEIAFLLPGVIAATLGAIAMRWRSDHNAPPRNAAVRLVALMAVAALLGGLDHIVEYDTGLNPGKWSANSLGILAGLLVAAVVVFRPRRVATAAPLFGPVVVGLLTIGAVAYTIDFWEGRDDSLLRITVDSTSQGYTLFVGEQLNAISAKTSSITPGELTADTLETSLQVTLYGREALDGAMLLQRNDSGAFELSASTSKLGGDFDTIFADWVAASNQDFLDQVALSGAIVPLGQLNLPTAEGSVEPYLAIAAPILADGSDTLTVFAMSLAEALTRSTLATVASTDAAFVDLYRIDQQGATLEWSTDAAAVAQLTDPAATIVSLPEVPTSIRGSVVVAEPFSLNPDTYTLVARRGEKLGTPLEFRRLVYGVEGFLGIGLAVLLVVISSQNFTRERERMRREALLAAALQGSPGWTAVVDQGDRVVMSNNNEHGVPAGALVAESLICRSDESTSTHVAQMLQEARGGLSGTYQHHWSDPTDPTNMMRIFQVDVRPLPDPRLVYLQCVDVTEQRDRAMRTAQSERMESIGVLAGSLAHDFNNLLFITLGYLQMLERQPIVAGDAQASTFVARAVEAVERGATVAKSLLSFARSQPLEASVITMEKFVGDLRPLIDQAIGSAHTFIVDIRGEGLAVSVDQGRLSSGLLNIIFNSRDAMDTKGTITLSVERTEAVASDGSLHDMVAIAVTDTGKGMPPEVAARAFEPFFTTKQVGSGTGLGLATVYSLAQQSGGWATVDSTEGVGTTITIYLPPAHTDAPVDDEGDTGGEWTIRRALVIDDEPALADLVSAWLTDLGLSVRTANTPDEAQKVAAEFKPQLVVSDANLRADMDGLELARTLVEVLPSLVVVFMTGFSDRIKALQAAGVATLAKPFTRDDLVKVLVQYTGYSRNGGAS